VNINKIQQLVPSTVDHEQCQEEPGSKHLSQVHYYFIHPCWYGANKRKCENPHLLILVPKLLCRFPVA